MNHWPQIVLLFFVGLTVVSGVITHGKDMKRNGIVTFIDNFVLLLILWCGGFFR